MSQKVDRRALSDDLYVHYGPVIGASSELNASGAETARQGGHVLRRFVDQLVRQARQTDPPRVAAPETAALAMGAVLERSTFYAAAGLVRVDRDELVDQLAAILHTGLFGGYRAGGRVRGLQGP